MKIRAHHLLCVNFFHGLGYNEKFIENLKKIVEKLRLNPKLEVEVVGECDDICAACPYMVDGLCKAEEDSEEEVKRMDVLVAKRLGIRFGEKLEAEKVLAVWEKFSPEDLKEICRTCDWVEECTKILREKKRERFEKT